MIQIVKDGIVLLGDKSGNILNIYGNDLFTLKPTKFIATLKEIVNSYKSDIDIDTVDAILDFYDKINSKNSSDT